MNKKGQTALGILFLLFLFFVLWMGFAGWIGDMGNDVVTNSNLTGLEKVIYGNLNVFIALGFLVSLLVVGAYAFF